MKLSERNEATGGPVGTDQFHYIRSNGDSPETFSSYRAPLDELPFPASPYDLPMSFAGTPGGGELLGMLSIVRDLEFAANFAGSVGHVGTNPDATYEIDVQDDGVSIGTISISTAGAFTFTTTSGTAKSVASGSLIEFIGSSDSPAEETISNISATLKGTA